MSDPTMYNSTSATASPGTSTRTSAPLIYSITFKPNTAGSPDLVTYRGISNINITLYSTGESCTIKQRGGQGARYKRYKTRQEMKKNLPIEKDSNAMNKNLAREDTRLPFPLKELVVTK